MLSNLRRTNVELLNLQEQLSTGRVVNRPSDDPGSVGSLTSLSVLMEKFDQQLGTLQRAQSTIDVTDVALADIVGMLEEAHGVALSQIGVQSTAEARANQAVVIDAFLDNIFAIANRQHQNVSLFGGRKSNVEPFIEQAGGYRYVGSRENLTADVGSTLPLEINTNGSDALGALSTRMTSSVDLDPAAAGNTRIADVNGARAKGVTLGSISLVVNAANTTVDLTPASTLGDVADIINDAITTLGGTGSIAVTADGFTLTAGGGETITIADIGTGITAADLGIAISATAGATVGGDIDPRLTLLTSVATLGAAPSLAGGLKITNGLESGTVSFAGVTTIEGMINAVDAQNLGVRLEINDADNSLNLVNEVSGTAMTIGENAGGTTATDLGLRSLDRNTILADFNDKQGVGRIAGLDDFRIELADGATTFDVNIDGAITVDDVVTDIENAATLAGLTLGADFTVQMAADGNGIELIDGIGGAGPFRVISLNDSPAASDLGILQNVGAGTTITGVDNAQIRTDSVFAHLIMLRDSLLNNDERLLTIAGQRVREDIDRVTVVRSSNGVRANRAQAEADRIESRKLQTSAVISDLRDTDFAEAISRFTQMQQQLEANLQVSGRTLQLNLLNFLR